MVLRQRSPRVAEAHDVQATGLAHMLKIPWTRPQYIDLEPESPRSRPGRAESVHIMRYKSTR